MKLSIIIPAYNVEEYLSKCLDSILGQDYSDYEVICVNDGSMDGTRAILEHYYGSHDNLIVINQENAGMSASRNRGIEHAKGDYIMFVDSDDWLEPSSLRSLMESANGEDVIEFQCRKYYEESGNYSETPVAGSTKTVCGGWDFFNQERLAVRDIHFVCVWQRLYRRGFLKEKNLRFEESVRRAEDDLFTTMVMWHAESVKVVSIVVYNYRVRPNSITTSVNIDRWYDSIKVQELLADFFVPLRGIEKKVINQVLASNYINFFSRRTHSLYGDNDRFLLDSVNWSNFRSVAVSRRHRTLYRMIVFSPRVFRQYERISKMIRFK